MRTNGQNLRRFLLNGEGRFRVYVLKGDKGIGRFVSLISCYYTQRFVSKWLDRAMLTENEPT